MESEQHYEIRDEQDLKNMKKKLNKLRSVKRSKSPSSKPSTRRPKPKLGKIIIDSEPTDTKSLSPPFSTSSSRSDISQKSAPLLSRRSSFKKAARTKKPLSESGHSSSNSVDNKTKRKSTPSKSNSGKALTRKASLKPLRVSISAKLKRVSPDKNEAISFSEDGAEKATCSSTLKGSKFDSTVQIQHGECEVNPDMKVCPFSYCSLHGHRHRNAPPLQRLISIRRRLLRNDRAKCREKRSQKATINNVRVGVSVYGDSEDVIESEKCVEAVKSSESLEEITARNSEKGSSSESLSEFENQETDDIKIEKENLEPEQSVSQRTKLKDQKYRKMWRLMYKHTVQGTENPNPENAEQEVGESKALIDETVTESYQIDAIKLVQQAFDEILLPELQELSPNEAKTTEKKASKSWSSLKKIFILKRFVKAMEEVKKINREIPKYLALKPEAEAERINLRRQRSEERKNASEWMLDFALQKVVSKLEPAQRQRVAMLVKAFETVIPQQESLSPSLSLKDCTENGEKARVEADEEDNSGTFVGKSLFRGLVSDFRQDRKSDIKPLQSAVTTGEEDAQFGKQSYMKLWGFVYTHMMSNIDEPDSKPMENAEKSRDPSDEKAILRRIEAIKLIEKAIDEIILPEIEETQQDVQSTSGTGSDDEPPEEKISVAKEEFSTTPSVSSERSEFSSDPFVSGEITQSSTKPPVSGERAQFSTELSVSGERAQFSINVTVSGERAHFSMEPSASGESVQFSTEPLVSGERAQFSINLTVSSKSTQFNTEPSISSEIVKFITKPSVPDETAEVSSEPSVSGEKVQFSIESSLSSERAQFSTESSILGERAQFSTDPIVSGKSAQISEDPENSTGESAENKRESVSTKPISRNWSNLKKKILLKRFIKALEGSKGFNPRPPRFLEPEAMSEAEKVNLKRQEMEERKRAEEWMVDHALQQAVARLTPARKRKVQLLVEAFETVTPSGRV